jgi:hypothetical protein
LRWKLDDTYQKECILIVDGERVRFEEDGETPYARPNVLVPRKRIGIFDGKVGIEYVPFGEGDYPYGAIDAADISHGLEYMGSLPLVMLYRGVSRDWITRFGDSSDIESGSIEGNECLVLTSRPLAQGRVASSVWLDVQRDYIPVRTTSTRGEKLVSQIDVWYRRDSQIGWAPSKWKRQHWRSDALWMSIDAAVSKAEINGQVDPSVFQFQFPSGAYVHDRQTKDDFIQRSNEERRRVTREEWNAGATYADLLETDYPWVPGKRTQSFPVFTVVAISSISILLVYLVIRLRGGVRKHGRRN